MFEKILNGVPQQMESIFFRGQAEGKSAAMLLRLDYLIKGDYIHSKSYSFIPCRLKAWKVTRRQ